MIIESIYWRRDLFRAAHELRRKAVQRIWRDATPAVIERTIMVGAFTCRRLLDSKKVATAIGNRAIVVAEAQHTGVDPRYWHEHAGWFPELFELYDFDQARDVMIKMRDLLNQFIHSHHLTYLRIEGELLVLVASDRKRDQGLIAVWLSQIAGLFEEVSMTEPESVVNEYRPDLGRYVLEARGSVISDRLSGWGFVEQADLDQAASRIRQPQEYASPATALHGEVTACRELDGADGGIHSS